MKKIGSILLLTCIITSCNELDKLQDHSIDSKDSHTQAEVQLSPEEIDLIESLLQETGE